MKKFLALSLCVLTLLCTACGGKKADIQLKGDAFSMTPQEYIDTMNRIATSNPEEGLLEISDYVESGEAIKLDSGISLSLTANDSGDLTGIEWSWFSDHFDNYLHDSNAYYYLGVTTRMVIPDEDEVDRVVDELQLLDNTQSEISAVSFSGDIGFTHSMTTFSLTRETPYHVVQILAPGYKF